MSASPNLKLPFLDPNQSQKTVTHNAALTVLDALVNLQVASTTLQAPPASLSDGQCWIVASGGSGAWLGKDLNIAAWQDGAWSFYAPNPGFVAYVDAIGGALMWNGSAWVSLLGAVTQLALTDLGIGTAVDPSNPLSAKLNAALFSAVPTSASPAGTGDVRVKLSKQATGNTASLLFQDNYAGRAEIGLAGDDNFHLRVSPDGSTFYDALVVTAGGGGVAFLGTPTHPTPAAGDSSTKSATTAFVATAVATGVAVTSVAGRTGAITLAIGDVTGAAPLASPAFSGMPTAPNAAAGTNTAQVATTSFVAASFVTYAYASANYATAASPTLTGIPTAPTPTAGDTSTKLATTAFVASAVVAGVAVTSVAGRTGAVTLATGDVTGAAPLASPAMTGTPTAPTAAAGTNTAQVATTSFVAASFVTYAYAGSTYATAASPTLTGTPTAPTPTVGDNSTKLATTAFVAAGYAPLASPTLTGTPTAPNAAAGTNTAQIATTSFVAASFVTYAYASANYATLASPTLTGTPTAPTPSAGDNSTKLATTSFVASSFLTSAAAASTYAPLASPALTGTPTAPTIAAGDSSTKIATTAFVARGFARTQVSDAAYTVLPTDRTVAVTALTAARILTLPAAAAYPQGATLTVVDESGACSGTRAVTVAAAGSDTVNGAASAVLAGPYAYVALESNGSNKWTVIDGSVGTSPLATAALGGSGSTIQFGILEQLVSTMSGTSATSTIQIPNRAIVFAVSCYVATPVSGPTSFSVGVSGNTSQFGSGIGTATGTQNSGVIGPTAFYAATPIVLTAASSTAFTAGAVRISIQYALFGPPTS